MQSFHIIIQSHIIQKHTSISNEYFERQCIEESNLIQSMKGQPEPAFFDSEVPYDLEQPGAYTENYHLTSLFDMYDGVGNLPHHTCMYISLIQTWIEDACRRTCQFGKQFDEVLHTYDLPSSPPILKIRTGLHFLINMSLLWLVTKDKRKKFKF